MGRPAHRGWRAGPVAAHAAAGTLDARPGGALWMAWWIAGDVPFVTKARAGPRALLKRLGSCGTLHR